MKFSLVWSLLNLLGEIDRSLNGTDILKNEDLIRNLHQNITADNTGSLQIAEVKLPECLLRGKN